VAIAFLPVALAGCMRERVVEMSAAPSPQLPIHVPMALDGTDVIVRLSFPQRDMQLEPGQFETNEICYLEAGQFRIDCYTDGSSLNLGPNDSTDLLTDNPMNGLAPLHADQSVADTMKLYGILFLVGGTMDRLPGALADYIQDPNQHLIEAVALADALLNQKTVEFQGWAHGGQFVVSVELTDSGHDKLEDALDEAGEPSGANQMVSLRRAGH
jgi:hypothetical protein